MQLTVPFQGLRFRYCAQCTLGFDPLEETMFRALDRAQYHSSLDGEQDRLSNIVDIFSQACLVSCLFHSATGTEMTEPLLE